MFKVNNVDTRTTLLTSFCCNFIVDFEQSLNLFSNVLIIEFKTGKYLLGRCEVKTLPWKISESGRLCSGTGVFPVNQGKFSE